MNTDIIAVPTGTASMTPARTTDSVVAAQIRATVEARYALAIHRPRNWDEVRIRLLTTCRRPGFAANKSTLYRKPIGAGVEGLGIRFVEEALRCMGNVLPETTVVYDDPERRVISVSVTDLEANLTYRSDISLQKTVERSRPDANGAYLSVRVNSRGENVYSILATEDEFQNKEAAAISKAIRSLGLRIIPGDLQDEAEEVIRQIRRDKAAQDPAAERKRIADAFAAMHVLPADLESYLGHPLAQCSPSELVDLRGLYGALKDGEATWASVMSNKDDVEGPQGTTAAVAVQKIESAKSLDDLSEIVPELKLLKGSEKTRAREAFKAKKEFLGKQAIPHEPAAETPPAVQVAIAADPAAQVAIAEDPAMHQTLIKFCEELNLNAEEVVTWCVKHQHLEEGKGLGELPQAKYTNLMEILPDIALQKLLEKIRTATTEEIATMLGNPPVWLYGEARQRYDDAINLREE